jgi:hypothetical protein
MDDVLSQGVAAFKAGDKTAARTYLLQAVKQQPNSERAWGWLYNVANNDQERIHCLRQVLRINPSNAKARQTLDDLESLAPPLELPSAPSGQALAVSKNKNNFLLYGFLGIAVLLFACVFVPGLLSLSQNAFAPAKSYAVTTGNDWKCWHDIVGSYVIEGVVRKTSETLTLRNVTLRGTAYDANQNVVGTEVTYTISDVLLPKSTSTFMFYMNDPGTSAVRCSVEVEDARIKQ